MHTLYEIKLEERFCPNTFQARYLFTNAPSDDNMGLYVNAQVLEDFKRQYVKYDHANLNAEQRKDLQDLFDRLDGIVKAQGLLEFVILKD